MLKNQLSDRIYTTLEKTQFFSITNILLQLSCMFVSAFYAIKAHFPLSISLLLGIISGIVYYICLQRQTIGLYIIIFVSSFFALPGRFLYIASPVGVIVELFTCGLWLNILRDQFKRRKVIRIFRNDLISISLACLLGFYILQIANPNMTSKLGGLFFIRKQISFLVFYYIAYSVFDSYDQIRSFLAFTFGLALLIALYGIKQQWFGLAPFEARWLQEDHSSYMLFFQSGFLRKFSILTDPAAFGVICSFFGLLSLLLAIKVTGPWKKTMLYIATIICLTGASYSGTRTCILMFISGLILYSVMTLNEKRTYLHLITLMFVSAFILFGPFQDNPVVARIKTSLQGSRDASANLRSINRHMIQPYIHRHPFGGGLNTSSLEGKLYNPTHALAGFPPDSGYMKILLEQGWFGLALHLLFYFIVLKRGVDCYFRARSSIIRNLYIAITVSLFSLIVGQYSQIAIAQYPLTLMFYGMLAILVRLIDFDRAERPETLQQPIGIQYANRLPAGHS